MYQSDIKTSSSVAICTLWEGDYHKGVGTFVNSLLMAGFKGKIWAGYQGDLPPWAETSEPHGMYRRMMPASGVEVIFVPLDVEQHLSHYKPTWCLRVLEELDTEATGIYYFDPDIFILAPWTFFEEWVCLGIACCEDYHLPLNPTHPILRRWQNFATSLQLTITSSPAACINSGLLGLLRTSSSFLHTWQAVLAHAHETYTLPKDLKSGNRADIFHNIDQDALNIALCATEHSISYMGIDAMAFGRGEWLTLHAVGYKPWRRRIVRDFIVGAVIPDRALRLYWDYAAGPIAVESPFRVKSHRWLIPITAFLGRFYHRA